MSNCLQFDIRSENGTRQVAHACALQLQAGDVILLKGDLGAGKSFFARAMLRALAQNPDLEVPSPTFCLVQSYQFAQVNCIHADLYRLSDESEAEELGLFDGGNLLLVEWPDRLPELQNMARFIFTFENLPTAPDARKLTVNANPDDLKKLGLSLESHSDVTISR